jgi:hypothetical protein
MVPTATTWAAMFPFSALATLTLTTGVTSGSFSATDFRQRQMIRTVRPKITTAIAAIAKIALRCRVDGFSMKIHRVRTGSGSDRVS